MHLVQILLPLTDNHRHPFPRDHYDRIALDMTERHGGVTAYTRSPAEGRWKPQGHTNAEEVVVIEVMVDHLDEDGWRAYRLHLEEVFRQQHIIIRAQPVKVL